MTKKDIYIGKEKISSGLQTSIVARIFKDNPKGFKEFWESYKDARFRGGASKEPTELQIKIAAYTKSSKENNRIVADKFKVKYHAVTAAIQKVAVWEYLNK